MSCAKFLSAPKKVDLQDIKKVFEYDQFALKFVEFYLIHWNYATVITLIKDTQKILVKLIKISLVQMEGHKLSKNLMMKMIGLWLTLTMVNLVIDSLK